ncbi:MAG: hypothetical protein FK734_17670 [Asgard group archaeon]|nr:hypothetical protein [Asgard group archaeon]
MTLNEEIVIKLDTAKTLISEVYEELDPKNYSKHYEKIWKARAEVEFIVIALKLVNNLTENDIGEKWKKDFSDVLKQVRSEVKIRQVFLETLNIFQSLEQIENIIEFYKKCWMLKEKITILLNVVKPKHKISSNKVA